MAESKWKDGRVEYFKGTGRLGRRRRNNIEERQQ